MNKEKTNMNSQKYEIIKQNKYGRRKTIRFKQYKYDIPIDNTNFLISENGCGPTCIATILASFGYKVDPIIISKIMLFNEYGILSDYSNVME